MLPAGTLPLVPAIWAWIGARLVLLELPESTNTSACVTNCTLFFVATIVPLGTTTEPLLLLVKTTVPVACTVPTVVVPVACPGPLALVL